MPGGAGFPTVSWVWWVNPSFLYGVAPRFARPKLWKCTVQNEMLFHPDPLWPWIKVNGTTEDEAPSCNCSRLERELYSCALYVTRNTRVPLYP